MTDKEVGKDNKWKQQVKVKNVGSGIYGFGLIGAAVYYLQHATSFFVGIIGIFKAIFWPAVLIYYLFDKLHL
ncbi:MAG TPA: hypothetical protein VLF89_08725 [Candidatus Saccharimonadales bacterium]|nr:hypothetical protein [Candidatus Saccharimonadales bacterium]